VLPWWPVGLSMTQPASPATRMPSRTKPPSETPGYSRGDAPPLRPHLVLQLKAPWRYEGTSGAFVTAGGKRFETKGRLPPGSSVVPTVARLQGRDPASLSGPEAKLARYVQVLLPQGTEAAGWLATIRQWPCVQSVDLPPEVGLPRPP